MNPHEDYSRTISNWRTKRSVWRVLHQSGHEVSITKLLNEIKRNPSEQYLKDLQKMEEEEDLESDKYPDVNMTKRS